MIDRALKKSVLLVEDSEDLVYEWGIVLRNNGFDVSHCASVHKAVELVNANHYAAIVVDFLLCDESSSTTEVGSDFLNQIRSSIMSRSDRPVIIGVSGSVDSQYMSARKRLEASGVDCFLDKPLSPHFLVQVIDRLLSVGL